MRLDTRVRLWGGYPLCQLAGLRAAS
jgi:hypothetical protein